ncbi:4-(cytidine 5'-diphospho)-2-C-methyl-D-erythritol kinase [Olivibacter sp. SDN3]|uniref:4-(cytidine 5'-diphospho)-2-C-methyl-D-erythritol kinase n=1 Tax=Olivibacter sp. SDN3 TaxID=2764720 RepID=UPI001651A661|nr:4-(cytidine 5'-diphospho)-2-C-methyl-D-erythritol kinase [Olivibacter sp. SDN3]QNL49118.1 4-(cytidine 5'-diphospho)-2-C-methyl-D-erythritol kinase [Olivibacter sp. SDN3]
MIIFANAKINIGLQVLNRRSDGYHNLETIFYPVKMHDVLEIVPGNELKLEVSGLDIPNNNQDNLCIRAYKALAKDFNLTPVHIYLHKNIPIGAGLGGGSADAAFLLKLLAQYFELNLSEETMENYARGLGADCCFFIKNTPVYATGIGDIFSDVDINLSIYHLVLITPNIHISTGEAYGSVKTTGKGKNLIEDIKRPVDQWKTHIFNDFEPGIFNRYPEIRGIKSSLYEKGALYAAMSGSGSTVYGIFKEKIDLGDLENRYQVFWING